MKWETRSAVVGDRADGTGRAGSVRNAARMAADLTNEKSQLRGPFESSVARKFGGILGGLFGAPQGLQSGWGHAWRPALACPAYAISDELRHRLTAIRDYL